MTKDVFIVALKLDFNYNLCFTVETTGVKEMSVMTTESSSGELAELGIKFYKEKLKHLLEPQHNGKFVAIEPHSGRYFVSENGTKALLDARKEMPDSKFYLARIGYKTTDRIGSYGSRKR